MSTKSKSLINLGLALSMWLFLAFKCSSIQPEEDRQAGIEIREYQSSQLAYCDEKMSAGYFMKQATLTPFETDAPNFRSQQLEPTPEEKGRGVVWKYETWFQPTRYRVLAGSKWSAWQTPSQAEKMGRATVRL